MIREGGARTDVGWHCCSQSGCSQNCCQNCPAGLIAVFVGVETAKKLCVAGIKERIHELATAWTNSGRKFTGSTGVPHNGDLRYRKHKFGDPKYQVSLPSHNR